jgi:hypothetical protein
VQDEYSLPFRERAYIHYQQERENLKQVVQRLRAKNTDEIAEYRAPLSIDERREMVILLSWGGPSDGFKVYLDLQGAVLEGYYFFADWFAYEEFKLSNEELDSVLTVYPLPTIC